MTRLHRAIAALMLLTACAPHDGRFDPSHFKWTGVGAPRDVVLPLGITPGSSFGGLTTAAPDREAFCCAAGPHVDVPVRKDHAATRLTIGTFLPAEGPPNHFRVTFPDGTVRTADGGRGFSTFSVPVPEALRPRRGTLRIRVDASVAPYTLASIYFE